MTPARTFLAICALALPVGPLAAGCGGDDGAASDDPRDVVERTFENDTRVTSGVFDLGATVSATGQQGGELSIALAGPFQGEDTDDPHLPQVDLSGTVTGEGAGESVDESARLIVTEDNAFVEYEDVTYEAGPETFDQLRQEFEEQGAGVDPRGSFREQCEQAISQLGSDTSICETDFVGDWLTNLENEGTEDVDGAETVHVSGELDVERMLADVVAFIETVPGATVQGIDPSQLTAAIPEASFDLYSGTEDDELRRLDFRLVVDTSAFTAGIAVMPVDEIEIDFALRLSGLNEEQTIDAPAGPTQPLEELLGDDFDLEDLGAGGLGGDGGIGTIPELDDSPGDSGGGGGDDLGGDIDSEQLEQIQECVEEAAGDPEALNACADEL